MLAIKTKFKDGVYASGICLVLISFALFCMPLKSTSNSEDSLFGLFCIHFGITVIYLVTVLSTGRLKKGRGGTGLMMIVLILALISAYALNRQMSVFEHSVTWFAVLLIISCVNILLADFFESLPAWARNIVSFILGVSFIAFAYLSLYLLPLYVISVLGAIVVGVSLHTYVPALLCIYCLVMVGKMRIYPGRHRIAFLLGTGLAVAACIAFIIYWSVLITGINNDYRKSTVRGDSDLPSWVRVAQRIPDNWASKRALKTELVYSVASSSGENWFWSMPRLRFDEERQHDPLIMMGSFFSGPLNIPTDARIKIVEAMYDSRHQAQARLWSGEDLLTEQVDTDVSLWPAIRLAYTELNITVSNFKNKSSWRNEQEAIYTFHLPDGGVVTSLSLWIEGKEAKGVLTTKAKADSAYTTIVGKERRDPSVVHWQEGNTVSVRVFPVLSGESRMFKIGVTAPMSLRADKLVYQPLYFDGPSGDGAREEVTVMFHQPPGVLSIPASLKKTGNGKYIGEGNYNSNWQIVCDALPVAGNRFCFDGHSYTISPWDKKRESATMSDIYLDINAAWSAEECNRVYDMLNGRRVWAAVSSDQLEEVTAESKELLFSKLMKRNFSLFPFYKIADISTSLVICKSNPAAPSVNDMKGSPFLKNLQDYFAHSTGIKLYNIGDDLSPYLKTLKEFRAFHYDQGSMATLTQLLAENTFVNTVENDQQVVIANAGIAVVQRVDSLPSVSPDHIMRIFSYNHILQKSGMGLLSGTVMEKDLVAEAEKAYVVSPVSSLVVLETQQDYDRFDIKGSKNSLQNASSKSKGAVPEPHEWALIIIVLLTLLYARYGSSYKMIRK